jgi:glycerophosphoryl diester phosphodiesterase
MKKDERLLIGKDHIITHRGLEPSRSNYFSESSLEAFKDQLSRGFGGIEFDPNPTKDGIIVMHDTNLSRPTNGKDTRNVADVPTDEIVSLPLPNGHIPTFAQVMDLIRKSDSSINAMHLKARFQTPEMLARIIDALGHYKEVFPKLIIFDIKPETARILKKHFPTLRLAPSIADSYDIERYNSAVGETLISINDAIALKEDGIIDGVWGDEWDTQGKNGKRKQLYTKENFDRLHEAGLFIALVTPELHSSSPGLYGGESHADAKDIKTLFKRIQQIKDAGADYFCTDYPEEVASL